MRCPARTGRQQGGRTGSTGRSGPSGGWDLKVPSHLLPVLGPGTLEEPGWRLQKIPGWRKQPRARVAAAGESERDEPPETELRPCPALQPPHAPPPTPLSLGAAPSADCLRNFRPSWSAKENLGVLELQSQFLWWCSVVVSYPLLLLGNLGTGYLAAHDIKEVLPFFFWQLRSFWLWAKLGCARARAEFRNSPGLGAEGAAG